MFLTFLTFLSPTLLGRSLTVGTWSSSRFHPVKRDFCLAADGGLYSMHKSW